MRHNGSKQQRTRARTTGLIGPIGMCLVALVLFSGQAGCPLLPGPAGPTGPAGPAGPAGTGGGAGGGVAPGINVTVDSVDVETADGRPEIEFTMTDDNGNPVSLADFGSSDIRFILGYLGTPAEVATANTSFLQPTTPSFISYTTEEEEADPAIGPNAGDSIRPAFDGARTSGVTQNSDGSFTYKFEEEVTVADDSATHQLAAQIRRNYSVDGLQYVDNPIFRFRPDDQPVTETRELVDTETCNNCHTRLALHGGTRREIQLCIMCHNSQNIDANTGNQAYFATMIHKIHRGADLPSVEDGQPYQILGFRDSVHDYSTVEFPQDVFNCTVCHQNAPQADAYLTANRAGCAACHDRTWFGLAAEIPDGFTAHPGGAMDDDVGCGGCHPATGGVAGILDVHRTPAEKAGVGLALDITDVSVDGTGTVLTVDFTAADGNGDPIDDIEAAGVQAGIVVAWPVPDYAENISEFFLGIGSSGTLVNNTGGSYSYTADAALPVSSDTFAVGMQARQPFDYEGETEEAGTATNSVTFFTTDGSDPVERRIVVDEEMACDKCHGEVRMHGDLRVGVDLCLMCHHANQTDEAQRPAEEMPPESVHFKTLIHKIHTGEELDQEYTVYGFGNTPHDFTHVRFPGDRRECSICHVEGSYDEVLPMAENVPEALPTVITQDDGMGGTIEISSTLPEAAACTACHDSFLVGFHAGLNTDFDNGVETCAVCHGDGADFAVSSVHDLGP